ncbi:hypothetical protein [Streptomyces fulvoviolaceus]|uniref:hypothetical protein n=1 Tax=Streptomyces fulvoviolaceus TaxID=285535 RepID=UPI0021C231C7|nr:hypothetical protein [Streptomyces fulvoviolaceus]MCT9077153.1 hypothetical protein [Streptomyces fulvoviolaceus]
MALAVVLGGLGSTAFAGQASAAESGVQATQVEFVRIQAQVTEDAGSDEPRLEWDDQQFWSATDVLEGQTRDINVTQPFHSASGLVELWEDDAPDDDDALGSATLAASDPVGTEKVLDFTQDDANYKLTVVLR